MNKIMKTTHFSPISRREFLKTTGIASSSAYIYSLSGCTLSNQETDSTKSGPSPWLFLELSDNQIRFILPRSEMGQDVATSFAIILAEEMAAPLELINIKYADADSKLGSQMTVGSASIRTWWLPLRQLGNQIKHLAIKAAAVKWSIASTECQILEGRIVHIPTGQSINYINALQSAMPPTGSSRPLSEKSAAENKVLTSTESGPLSEPSSFKLIGKDVTSILARDKVMGNFNFVGDNNDKKILTAMTVVYQASWPIPTQQQLGRLKEQFSLTHTFIMDHMLSGYQFRVVLVNDKTWPLLKAKKELELTLKQWLKKNRRDEPSHFEKVVSEQNTPDVLDKQTLSLSFYTPYVAHAPMETETAIACFHEKNRLEIWAPTQAPQHARRSIANKLNLKENEITLHTSALGGSFGRKRYDDFIIEAALISQAMFEKKHSDPVKLLWTREDDLGREHYRPATFQSLSWSSKDKTKIQHRLIESHRPNLAPQSSEHNFFPHLDWEIKTLKSSLPSKHITGIWRSVHHGYLAFSICSFIDELSYFNAQDPIEYYRQHVASLGIKQLLKVSIDPSTRYQPERLLNTMNTVKKLSGWPSNTHANSALGFASYYCFKSYISIVVKISLEKERIKVEHIWASVDCGTAIHPDGLKAQVEGGLIFGLSACLYGEIPEDSDLLMMNFDRYQVARMSDTPEIEVHIQKSNFDPSGAGELGVPTIAPAIANAYRKLTGKRFLRMPFLKNGRMNNNSFAEL
ncbi:MAG: isoquinoline 1-oxidoreductase beta subunit [Paraglaciecola sp.]|jgi:isoquinoline 1-oxidoreductase beta subunit